MFVRSKPAKVASLAANIGKALSQTALLWAMFLFAIPAAIRWIENYTVLHKLRFNPGIFAYVAIFVFVICALSGFWSGLVLVKFGNGTPFPFACPHKFVIAGLYRYIRNPMTLLGISQGVAVGVYLGSWLIVSYGLIGAFAWNYIARPWEESDLLQRFGEQYERYRQHVPCWRFRFTPYKE